MSHASFSERETSHARLIPSRLSAGIRIRRLGIRIFVAAIAASVVNGCSDSPATPTSPAQNSVTALNLPFVAAKKQAWCWAAVTEMILTYYGRPASQCEIASEGDQNDEPLCCGDPTDCGDGKSIFGIKHILALHGISSEFDFSPQTLSTVKTEILAGRPVVASFDDAIDETYDGSFAGHSALIYGFTSDDHLLIHDPHFGSFSVPAGVDLGYAPKTRWNESLVQVAP